MNTKNIYLAKLLISTDQFRLFNFDKYLLGIYIVTN